MSTRELIDTGTDKRYVRRNEQGQFKESDPCRPTSATTPSIRRNRVRVTRATASASEDLQLQRQWRKQPAGCAASLAGRGRAGRCRSSRAEDT